MRSLFLVVCAAAGLLTAEPADPATAERLLQIQDAHWVEREASRFAAALGQDPAPIRRQLAERLYRTRDLHGIDILQPALIWWRTDGGPMTALIPLKDRRIFCDGFGVATPPLVRVGEREGTVVYTQNLPAGLREYRLLAVGEVAVIGRSVDEVQQLAPRIPELLVTDPALPALRLVLRGAALREALTLPPWLPVPRLPASALDPRPALTALGAWLAQESLSLAVELRPVGTTHARLTLQLKARPDGELASWLTSQQNQATRIVGLVEGPATALAITARVGWTGRLEGMPERLGPRQRAGLSGAWSPAVEESWRQVWRLAERIGEMALAIDEAPDGGSLVSAICEQPRATEQLTHLNALAAGATGDPGRSGEIAGMPVVIRTVDGRTEATAAGARHIISVSASGAAAAQTADMAVRLAVSAAQVVPPRGTPGILVLRGDLGRMVRLLPGANREAEVVPAPCTGLLAVRPGGILQFEVTVPLEPAARALSRLPHGWW